MQCLLIEDQPVFQEGIEQQLKRQLPSIPFAFSGNDPSLPLYEQLDASELCIWGLNETNQHLWPEVQAAAQQQKLPVILLCGIAGLKWVRLSLEAGFVGLVYKDLPEDLCPEAVQAVLEKQRYIASWYARNLLISILPASQNQEICVVNRPWQITLGDAQFLRLLCQDLSTQDIADQLQVQVSTVYRRQRDLRRKLNLDSIAKLIPWSYLHLAEFL